VLQGVTSPLKIETVAFVPMGPESASPILATKGLSAQPSSASQAGFRFHSDLLADCCIEWCLPFESS